MKEYESFPTFTPTHHALLFAWISRAVIERVGTETGEDAIRRAVRRYGEQRGRRMALRAKANRHPLTMNHYMAYREWKADPGESQSQVVATEPQLTLNVLSCPWQRAWEDNALMSFGRLYCREIDVALVHGFNPELRLDVNSTLTNDYAPCEFVYHGTDPDAAEDLTVDADQTVMPWEYHLGHLFKTMGQVLNEELGKDGEEAIQSALESFSARFGEQAAAILLLHQDTDFDRLSE